MDYLSMTIGKQKKIQPIQTMTICVFFEWQMQSLIRKSMDYSVKG